jgi:hypothetical protein
MYSAERMYLSPIFDIAKCLVDLLPDCLMMGFRPTYFVACFAVLNCLSANRVRMCGIVPSLMAVMDFRSFACWFNSLSDLMRDWMTISMTLISDWVFLMLVSIYGFI